MNHSAVRVIRDEHASLAAMLKSMLQMIQRGPDADGQAVTAGEIPSLAGCSFSARKEEGAAPKDDPCLVSSRRLRRRAPA